MSLLQSAALLSAYRQCCLVLGSVSVVWHWVSLVQSLLSWAHVRCIAPPSMGMVLEIVSLMQTAGMVQSLFSWAHVRCIAPPSMGMVLEIVSPMRTASVVAVVLL